MAKVIVSVNKNKTKEGIKIQFVLPQNINDNDRNTFIEKYQNKLTKSLSKYGLIPNIDNNVLYSNVIGFFIPIQNIQSLIQNALSNEKKNNTTF